MTEYTKIKMDSARQKRLEELELEYKSALIRISDIEEVLQSDSRAGIKATQEFVSATIKSVAQDTELFVIMLDSDTTKDRAELIHRLNVFYLCLTLGSGMGLSRTQLYELGVAATLHDIGKTRIPRQIILKHPPYTPAEKQLLERHPQYGVEILTEEKSISKNVVDAILQHHEKCNGTGYPHKRTAQNTSLMAKIIAIANTYDNICSRYYLKRLLTPHESVSYLYTRLRDELALDIIKIFIKMVGVYPPGCLVELSDGKMGIVIATNKDQSTCPIIILYDETTPREKPFVINLNDVEGLSIVRSILPTEAPGEVALYLQREDRICLFTGSLTGRNVPAEPAPALAVEQGSNPVPFERRVILRAKPVQGIGVSISFQGTEVDIVDISVGGVCMSKSQDFFLKPQETVTVTISVDDKEFDVKSMVTRIWSSQLDSGFHYFVSLQFLSNPAMREALLGKKVLLLEKENNPATVNRRMGFRVRPLPNSGLSVFFQETAVNVIDISVGGACISRSQELSLTSQETVTLIISVDGKRFDVKSTVIRTWSSQSASGSQYFASIQFVGNPAMRESLLGKKIMHLERERFLNKLD